MWCIAHGCAFSVSSDNGVTIQQWCSLIRGVYSSWPYLPCMERQKMNSPLNVQPKPRASPWLKERSLPLRCLTSIAIDAIAPHIK